MNFLIILDLLCQQEHTDPTENAVSLYYYFLKIFLYIFFLELYERVTSRAGPKHFLAIGGWTDSDGAKYSKLVSSREARKRFAAHAATYLVSHGFNGLNIDWAYPTCWQSDCNAGPASDRERLTDLVRELKSIFSLHNPPLEVGVSISGYKEVIEKAYDFRALAGNCFVIFINK